jgi:hypothetical protein
VYWPIYHALAQSGINAEWKTSCEQEPFKTDRSVYEACKTAAANQRKGLTMYLADPTQIPLAEQNDWFIIPVLWRLPHWLICNQTHLKSNGMDEKSRIKISDSGQFEQCQLNGQKILIFPADSTSGKVARGLMGLEEDNFTSEYATVESIYEQLMKNEGGNHNLTLTFTPLHRVFPGKFHHLARFVGKLDPVTSLCIYRKGLETKELAYAMNCEKRIRLALMDIISAMYLTQGVPDAISKLVQPESGQDIFSSLCCPEAPKNSNSFITLMLENDTNQIDVPQADLRLSRALSSYIVHTAYFPYHVITKTFINLISDTVRQGLLNFNDIVNSGITDLLHTELNSKKWMDYSIGQRYESRMIKSDNSIAQPSLTANDSDKTFKAIAHTEDTRWKDKSGNFKPLNQFVCQIGQDRLRLSVAYPDSIIGDHDRCRRDGKASHKSSCLATPPHNLCPRCYLGGYACAVLHLLDAHLKKLGFSKIISNGPPRLDGLISTPFVAEDFVPFLNLLTLFKEKAVQILFWEESSAADAVYFRFAFSNPIQGSSGNGNLTQSMKKLCEDQSVQHSTEEHRVQFEFRKYISSLLDQKLSDPVQNPNYCLADEIKNSSEGWGVFEIAATIKDNRNLGL